MPRTARVLVDNGCYHILTRGNNRAAVFHEAADYQRYGQLLLELFAIQRIQLYHYCFMTNHVHLLVRTATAVGLRQAMQQLNLRYALLYKRKYGHTGHFWQDRFKSLLIADDSYLLQCGAYIELNPVRARMVKQAEAYPWSSARWYLTGHRDPLITSSPAYLNLGSTAVDRQKHYRQLLVAQLATVNTPSNALPGSASHWRAVAAMAGLPPLRSRGRPRKITLLANAEK